MTFVITDACVDVKDQTCVTECPVDCIYEGPRSLYIHPDECIDCGACEPVCPVSAILPDYRLDEAQQPALLRAKELFAVTGLLNGAKRHGPLAEDHASVAAQPPKD